MITWRGFIYFVFTGLISIALFYTGMDVYLRLLAVLILLPVLSTVQLVLIIRHLTYQQSINPLVIARQQKTSLEIKFSQSGMFSPGLINITVLKPPRNKKSNYADYDLAVLKSEPKTLNIEVESSHRGLFPVGITRIMARDLFGLFWLPVQSRHKCRNNLLMLTSTPKSAEITNREKISSMLEHLHEMKSQDFGSEINDIANLRSQLPGDSLRRVHWKLSARLDETIIKEFEKPQQQEILVLWDVRKLSLYGLAEADYLDMYTDIALAIADDLLKTGNYVRFVSCQDKSLIQIEADSEAGLELVKLELAGIDWNSEIPVANIIKEETSNNSSTAMFIFLTTSISPDLIDILRQLKFKGIEVLLVFLPSRQPDMLIQRKLKQMDTEGIYTWMPELLPKDKNGQIN